VCRGPGSNYKRVKRSLFLFINRWKLQLCATIDRIGPAGTTRGDGRKEGDDGRVGRATAAVFHYYLLNIITIRLSIYYILFIYLLLHDRAGTFLTTLPRTRSARVLLTKMEVEVVLGVHCIFTKRTSSTPSCIEQMLFCYAECCILFLMILSGLVDEGQIEK
jgi:hypothetical protein